MCETSQISFQLNETLLLLQSTPMNRNANKSKNIPLPLYLSFTLTHTHIPSSVLVSSNLSSYKRTIEQFNALRSFCVWCVLSHQSVGYFITVILCLCCIFCVSLVCSFVCFICYLYGLIMNFTKVSWLCFCDEMNKMVRFVRLVIFFFSHGCLIDMKP